jgi:protein-disulfide isomerase
MNTESKLSVPLAIVVAGIIIGGAIFFSRGTPSKDKPASDTLPPAAPAGKFEPVSEKDHILGNPNASVVVIEYSDFECPFCKRFHPTMKRIIDEYGKTGQVAWVYRHFPLYKGNPPLHSKAGKEAEASECAAEQGGNTAFWAYSDRLFEITPANNGLDLNELPKIAEFVGLNRAAFEACLESGKYADDIEKAYNAALSAGAQGTPYNILVAKNGKTTVLNGAYPYEDLKAAIESLLKN